jgi:hypothetical protein
MGIPTRDIAARGAGEVAAQAPPGYPSPREAFEARRKALARRDWRTSFASSTPAAQELEVANLVGSWVLMESGLVADPFVKLGVFERIAGKARLRALMKMHGFELTELWAEYDKGYRAAYGVDLAKWKAEIRKRRRERTERYLKDHPLEREEFEKLLRDSPEVDHVPPGPGEAPDPPPPAPEFDDELLLKTIKTVASRVTDKAAFYEEVSEILHVRGQEAPELIYDFGDLQGIAVSGDSARGWIVWNRHHVYEAGVKKVSGSEHLLRKFRRLDGRWFNDSETWDYTRFDPKEVQR